MSINPPAGSSQPKTVSLPLSAESAADVLESPPAVPAAHGLGNQPRYDTNHAAAAKNTSSRERDVPVSCIYS